MINFRIKTLFSLFPDCLLLLLQTGSFKGRFLNLVAGIEPEYTFMRWRMQLL